MPISQHVLRVTRWWRAEQHRHFLIYVSCIAMGIAIYFALPREPAPALLLAGSVAVMAGLIAAARYRPARPWLWMLGLTLAGLCWASYHTHRQELTVLSRELSPRPVQGIVTDTERTETGLRITLREVSIRNLAPEETPERIRLTLRQRAGETTPAPPVGSRIDLLAGLLPPMGPGMPHGFDFARYFFFRGIGAVGYGLPPWKLEEPSARVGLAEDFANWRIGITENIITTLGPRHGPIAAGLITGEDRAILESDYEALKAANLYHIIAISGGHMVVIAGVVFLLMRWLTLLLPSCWRYRPEMKSLAAFATLLLVTAYLFVTGMPPSAVRAYVMIALVLLAVMLRRQVDPMRSLVIAALLMLLADPSDLFEPGFQLSFVATLAIVALVERLFLGPQRDDSRMRRFGRILLATMLISVVAEAATAPLVIAQFNMFSSYGVLANLLATPLVSLLMMPVVALYFLLLPLGLEMAALWALDYAIAAMLWIAHTIAALPYAQWFIPSLPGWGVALFVLGLLWFCYWLRRPRWLGVPLMLAGIASVATVTLPDLLVGAELKQIALRTAEGPMLARGRSSSLVPELWAHGLGVKTMPRASRDSEYWQCDALGCVARIAGQTVAFPENGLALAEDCAQASLVITTLFSVRCPVATVRNGWDLYRGGIHAFWWEGTGWRIETSADWQGERPWSGR